MKVKTLQEMKDSGFLELGQVYVERYYTYHCKKILGIKFKYRKRHFKLIRFKSLDDFIYDELFDSWYNYDPFKIGTSCYCGKNYELDIVKYNERMFKGFKFKNFK